jgi:hypothetical protein
MRWLYMELANSHAGQAKRSETTRRKRASAKPPTDQDEGHWAPGSSTVLARGGVMSSVNLGYLYARLDPFGSRSSYALEI